MKPGRRRAALGALAGATILLQTFGASAALGQAGTADDAGTQPETSQATVDRANQLAGIACAGTAASARASRKDPTSVAKASRAAADAADCAAARTNAEKEVASFQSINAGAPNDNDAPAPLPDTHNTAAGAIKSDNIQWLYNTVGTNGNFAGANFLHFEKLGYDFMIGDGTGGLSIWSLKDPAKPAFTSAVTAAQLMRGADEHGPADTQARFYEGENPTVDQRRKLVYLARDPRSFGNRSHPEGRTGLYIIDIKDPWHPQLVAYHWVPAGHTQTCINDCRYLWSVGPANNGSHVTGQPQDIAGVPQSDWTGVPAFVTDVRDVNHPYTYAQPVDTKRNNNTTAYTHSVDVDQNGIAWTSGFGGVRGYWTSGLHHDPATNTDRYASATNPVPYAGGSVPNNDPSYGSSNIDHNSFHVTQAASDHSPKTVTASDGTTYNKTDLLYTTQENVVSCTSTSGGGPGRFVVSTLAGSYNGEAWSPSLSATNRFFIKKLGDYTPLDQPGANPSASCSAHWFTMLGDMAAIAFYGQGTRILDVSDPTKPAQAAYIRIPAIAADGSTPAQVGNSASAAYWHDRYVYVADYSRGIDVLKYTGDVKGTIQPRVCWNSCASSQTAGVWTTGDGSVGGTVPATLSITLGAPASFGPFAAGVAKDYTAQQAATVTSSAGDATLSIADPSSNATGHLVNGSFSLPSALQAKAASQAAGPGGAFTNIGGSSNPTSLLTYTGPTSNDPVTVSFLQHIGQNDPLRSGSYSKTLTFTLSTTQP